MIQWLTAGKVLGVSLVMSIAGVCVGVAISTVTDVSFNVLGTQVALAGVAVTSLYQIRVGEIQKELDLDPQSLLYYQAPFAALVVTPIALAFEGQALMNHTWTGAQLEVIVLSAILAVSVNLSIFSVIRATSALSYNIVGHFKTCLLLASDFVLFGVALTAGKAVGLMLTIAAIISYTAIKLSNQPLPVPADEERRLPLTSSDTESD